MLATSPFAQIETEESFISESAKTAAKVRAEALRDFLETQVYLAAPEDIRNKAFPRGLLIRLTRTPPSEGLFSAPEDNPEHELRVELKSDLWMSRNAEHLLAHEVFHAIHYKVHPGEAPWIREGLAALFEFIVLGELNQTNSEAALGQFTTPLEGTYQIGSINPEQYGHDLLYFYYLYTHCGGDRLFWRLTRGVPGMTGDHAIDEILKSSGSKAPECASFAESALSFELARVHNHEFYGSKGTRRYFLLALTRPPRALGVVENSEVLSDLPTDTLSSRLLERLEPYSPLVIGANTRLPRQVPDGISIFWVQSIFPYAVTTERPQEYEHWRAVIVNTKFVDKMQRKL